MDGGEDDIKMSFPENESPAALSKYTDLVITTLQSYGWFLLFGTIALYYLWQKIQPHLNKWKEHKEYIKMEKADPDRLYRQQEAMEAARRKQQEIQDAHAERFKERQQQLLEQKRHEKIKDWDRHQEGKGYRSKHKPQSSDDMGGNDKKNKPKANQTSKINGGYNPLMGSSSGPSYRPNRRDFSGGGG